MMQAHALIAVASVPARVGCGMNDTPDYLPQGRKPSDLEKLRPYLMRYACTKFNDVYMAEDLVQEAMLAALAGKSPFMSRSALRTWVTGILKHKIVDAYRRLANEKRQYTSGGAEEHDGDGGVDIWQMEALCHSQTAPETRDGLADPALEIERKQLASSLMCAVSNLPTRQRDAFVMVHMHGISSMDAARRAGVSLNNLWVILHRSRKALQVELRSAYAI